MDGKSMRSPRPQASLSRVAIVTVHGTWAPRAPWAQKDSALGLELVLWFAAKGLEAVVMPFQWSGRNSIHARHEAGIQLAELLARTLRDDSVGEIYVIAHSHGGSVLAHALKEAPELSSAISGFIALATPWLGARSSGYAIQLRTLLISLTFLGALLGTIALVAVLINYMVFRDISPHGGSDGWAADLGEVLGLSITAIIYTEIAGLFVAAAGYLTWRLWLSPRLETGAKAFHLKVESWARRANTLDVEFPKNSVFLKPAGDEAALALGWASAMAALTQGTSTLLFWILQSGLDLWRRTPKWVQILGGLILSMAMLSGSYMALMDWFGSYWPVDRSIAGLLWKIVSVFKLPMSQDDWLGYGLVMTFAALELVSIVLWALLSVFFGSVLLLLAIALTSAVGAGVAFPTALFLDLWVEAVPAGDRRLVLVEVRPEASEVGRIERTPLSHSALYSNRSAINAVTCALAEFQQRK